MKISLFFAVSGLLFNMCCSHVYAQGKQPLNEAQYFSNNFKEIINPLPEKIRWIDAKKLMFVRDAKTFILDASTGKEHEATEMEKAGLVVLPPVFTKGTDLYYRRDGNEVRLTNDPAQEQNATLSPDANSVAYTKNNNLYSIDLRTMKESKLTNDGSDVILNGYASWVYMEEILGRRSQYRAFWWSPDSKKLAFFRTNDQPVPQYTITDAPDQHGYKETMRYPKVGDPNPEVAIGIVEATGGDIVWADFNPLQDQYFGAPYWTPDGAALWVQWMSRDQQHLKIWAIQPQSGNKSLILEETQQTWIDLSDAGSRIHFLPVKKGFLYLSDATGFKHIYHYDMQGKLLRTVTEGRYSVTDLHHVDAETEMIYFSARKENTARKDFYRITTSGKKLQRLSFGDFHHSSILVAPEAKFFISTFSNCETPTAIELCSIDGKRLKSIGDSRGEKWATTSLAKTEVIRVKSDDGKFELPMKITWPENRQPGKKYPVLISIYGGPNAGTVMDNWVLNGNQQWYAHENLIQVAMDHRGSGHFGKEGANYMYHNLGYWEMKDYTSLAKWLVANADADSTKMAITGFSYGGYLSCYALTYGADVFTHGMAGGSVVDWRLYDSHYTERFMGNQTTNAAGYQSASVLTHVNKYKGKLQIVHGIIDENVHIQNSIQLSSALQEEKKDFEQMFYSGGRHGWAGNKGNHFQNLKTQFIYKYLLEKKVPTGLLK